MQQKFDITGMSCGACSANIEKSLSRQSGIKDLSVNLLQNSMNVNFDENIISVKDIIKSVSNCGYGASIHGELANDSDKAPNEEIEIKSMKTRLIFSLIILVPLMYVTMGHMVSLPLPNFLTGIENAVSNALTQMLLTLPVMYINRKFFTVGFKALWHRSPNMDSLVAVGSSSAFIYGVFAIYRMSYGLGIGDFELVMKYNHDLYFESAAMILALITLGKYLEAKSKGKTNQAVKALLDLAPETALVFRDGKEILIPSEEIVKGDIIIVKQGSSIPADGIIIEGSCSIDESAISGESIPVEKYVGSNVIGATTLKAGYIKFTAEKVGADTTLSQIIKLVEDASAGKAPIARLADKVSAIFVPVVMGLAIITGVIWIALGYEFEFALARAITVLVISCPCALGLATPTAIMVGNGKGAQNGILFKTAEALEKLHTIDTVVFDKTGTITEGKPKVTDVINISAFDDNTLISIFSAIEKLSEHPLSEAIVEYCEKLNIALPNASNFKATAGQGIIGTVNDVKYLCGNVLMMKENNISIPKKIEETLKTLSMEGKTVLIASDTENCLGLFAVADVIKTSAKEAVEKLSAMGINVIMLTGDNEITANAVKKQVGIKTAIAQVLPQDKESHIRRLISEGKKVAMVGDGINDAPALTRADVGIAIGAGTDVAIQSADVVLVKSDILDSVTAIKLSRFVIKNIKQNLFWAFFYNVLCIPLAAGVFIIPFGISLNPMIGAAAMSLSSIFVVSNSLRIRFFKGEKSNSNIINKKIEKEKFIMEKIMTIEGMTCGHCKSRVEKVLGETDGINSAIVDLENKTATINLSSDLSNETLTKIITDAGYEVISVN